MFVVFSPNLMSHLKKSCLAVVKIVGRDELELVFNL